jgi:hypothetical protein
MTEEMVNGFDFDKKVPHIDYDVEASMFFGGSSHQARGAYNDQKAAHDRRNCSGALRRKYLQVCIFRRSLEIHTSTIAPMDTMLCGSSRPFKTLDAATSLPKP